VKKFTTELQLKWLRKNTKMKEAKYAGQQAKDDIKKDPKFNKLNMNARKEAESELDKGGIVDLGEDTLNEMEFFTVSVVIPDQLPNGIAALQRLRNEAQSLVDSSFIDEQGDTLTISFMRKSDAENFTEYARTLGIPEEYIEQPERDTEPDNMEADEIEEFVSDSAGNEIYLEDIIEIKGRKFKIMEGEDGRAHIGTLQGRTVLPVGDRRAHTLLRNSTRVNDDESGMRKMDVHSIGHIDDEPGMLKQYAYDIVDYGLKLYKILEELDRMDHHVDLPNWLQANIIKGRENISKATHYLEYEMNEPKLDAMLAEKNDKK
jgi:hypothetical protein